MSEATVIALGFFDGVVLGQGGVLGYTGVSGWVVGRRSRAAAHERGGARGDHP